MELVGQLRSGSPEQTHVLGVRLGRLLEPGHVVGLVGELGAGKTCLAAGVAEGMGVDSGTYVASPTFTLVNEYTTPSVPLVHMDFYRLEDPEDLVEVGVDDYYRGDFACLVEWFDRFPRQAPSGYLRVELVVSGDDQRSIELHAVGEAHRLLGLWWVTGQAGDH